LYLSDDSVASFSIAAGAAAAVGKRVQAQQYGQSAAIRWTTRHAATPAFSVRQSMQMRPLASQ